MTSLPQLPDLDIKEQVGVGGMATVWKAWDRFRERDVAVKVLNPSITGNRDDIDLFIAEAKVMSSINHAGIVKCYELRQHGGLWYYVMEFVDGYNFASLLARKQHLRISDCLLICESVAVALDYAWNVHGLVHCDIKPENIMINTDGIVKLTDLGVCHIFEYLADGKQEVPDQVLGTPAYISPEQVYGDVELDCRSDIYSLAATLFHLATGRVLFAGMDDNSMIRAHCDENCQSKDPRAYHPGITEGFCQMLEAMLVKDRDYRMSSWENVIATSVMVEKGLAFKPRSTPGVSSLGLGIF